MLFIRNKMPQGCTLISSVLFWASSGWRLLQKSQLDLKNPANVVAWCEPEILRSEFYGWTEPRPWDCSVWNPSMKHHWFPTVPQGKQHWCHFLVKISVTCLKKKSHFYVGVNGSPFANLLWWAYTIAHMYQLVLINTSAIRLILKSICIATV